MKDWKNKIDALNDMILRQSDEMIVLSWKLDKWNPSLSQEIRRVAHRMIDISAYYIHQLME